MIFQELVRSCPAIANMKDDAVSVGQHERHEWYPRWLPAAKIFRQAIEQAAEITKLPAARIREVALTGLLDTYFCSKRRRRQRPAAIDSGAVVAQL